MHKDRQVRQQKDRQNKQGRDEKRTKEGKEARKERDERSRSRSRQRKPRTDLVPYGHDDEPLPEKTHVSCRRCKELTFSLTTRTCSSCGYPKQTRPSYFPVAKQVQVLDLVREGKLVHNSYAPVLIQVVANDRFGKRQRIKCCPTDTILQFKKLISAQIGTRPQKIRLQKGNVIYKDHITLQDYEIKDGMGLQMYYD